MLKKYVFVVAIAGLLITPVFAHTDNSEIAPQSGHLKHLIELFTVGGRPVNLDASRKATILINHGYVLGYSEDRRNPLWSAYRASGISGNASRVRYERASFFFTDTRTTAAVNGQTFGGGFDRGHMTPNSAIASQYGSLAQLETFFMTNMCPQKAALNRGPWARLERYVIDAAQKFKHIFVIAGPIFADDPAMVANGPARKIQIPEAFFMILLDADREFQVRPTIKILAYRFPQDTPGGADITDRDEFGVSVNQIESETNLDFFPKFNALFNNWEDREDEKVLEVWDLS